MLRVLCILRHWMLHFHIERLSPLSIHSEKYTSIFYANNLASSSIVGYNASIPLP
jgi:hypothetical protein